MAKGLPRSMARAAPLRDEIIKQTIDLAGTVAITGVDSAVDAGEIVIGADLPEGNILLLGAVAYLTIDGTDDEVIADWTGDYSIGTVPNSNDVDVGDTGEADIIQSTAITADSGLKVATAVRGTTGTTGVILDNTDGSLELNLNILIDDNVITDTEAPTFTASGQLYIAYIVLGDD